MLLTNSNICRAEYDTNALRLIMIIVFFLYIYFAKIAIILRAMNQKQKTNQAIAVNRKAHHEFSIEGRFEAGIVLQGWEVKSLRAGEVQLDQGYVILKNGEVWLL